MLQRESAGRAATVSDTYKSRPNRRQVLTTNVPHAEASMSGGVMRPMTKLKNQLEATDSATPLARVEV